MKSLLTSSAYLKFVRARNRALEDLHLRAQLNVSATLHDCLLDARDLITSRYPRLVLGGIYSQQGQEISRELQSALARIFHQAAVVMAIDLRKLRRSVYILTVTSEAEAIGQALGKVQKYSLTRDKVIGKENAPSYLGGSIENRVQLAMNRLLRKLMSAVELSAISGDELGDLLDRIDRAVPKTKKTTTEPRNLTVGKKLHEAAQARSPDMSFGFIDDDSWEEMVQDYTNEFVPSWRGPESSYTVRKETGGTAEIYGWELETLTTQDFVYQVRQGQIEAAKENGITDYVWVAIVDDRTDDCCLWRDGLTTAEIEKMLKSERRDDECQALVPPAHFNCRCALAPMTEEMPERPESNVKEFEDWLNS